MKQPYFKLLLVLIPVFLAGCAHKYQPDLSGKPTARVRMVTMHTDLTRAVVLSGACVPYDAFAWDSNTETMEMFWAKDSSPERHSLGIPLTDIPRNAAFTEQYILAGVSINLAFSATRVGGPVNSECATAISFVPEVGADYEARFSQVPDGCAMKLNRLRVKNDNKIEIETVPTAKWLPRC